jgi:hypothetical protein
MGIGELKRAKALAREIKQLAQAPISKLFAL